MAERRSPAADQRTLSYLPPPGSGREGRFRRAPRLRRGAGLAMTFFAYNLIKKHDSLKGRTPAMAAGITDRVFTVRDMLFAADSIALAAQRAWLRYIPYSNIP